MARHKDDTDAWLALSEADKQQVIDRVKATGEDYYTAISAVNEERFYAKNPHCRREAIQPLVEDDDPEPPAPWWKFW